MRYLIGLPVFKRDWILPDWLRCIEKQTVPLSDIGFLFAMAPEQEDPKTYKVLFEWQSQHPEIAYFDIISDEEKDHTVHVPGTRCWKPPDYIKMARLRNSLLERVRTLQPQQYFSLDSDILIEDPMTMEILTDELINFNAVSPLVYMSPASTDHPNVMSWKTKPGREVTRRSQNYPIGEVFQADVIMAAVMMDPEAYTKADYLPHVSGEDPGWSFSMYTNGLTMGLVSTVYCPHIMHTVAPVNRKVEYQDAPGIYSIYKERGDNRHKMLV